MSSPVQPPSYENYLLMIGISLFIFVGVIIATYLMVPRHHHRLYFPSLDQSQFGICWCYGPNEPWSPLMYVISIRGSEYLLSYLWMLKDFCWTQDYWLFGQFFGVMSVLWSSALVFRSIYIEHYREVMISTATTLWLLASFSWMRGELIGKSVLT